MTPQRSMQRSAGFSLIEIIIVITIIGLIVGWAATNIFGKQDQAQWRVAKSQITQLGATLDQYKLDTGRYPTGLKVSDSELAALNLIRADFHGEWNYHILPA